MFFTGWPRFLRGKTAANKQTRRPRQRFRPDVEGLEDRRLLAVAGSLDPTFATQGLFNGELPGNRSAAASAVALQQKDGKIVVVGTTEDANRDVVIARFNTNGSIDTGFGSAGVRYLDLGANTVDEATAVAVDAAGRIVVSGNTTAAAPTLTGTNTKQNFFVLRVDTNGQLDSSFDQDGKLIIDFNSDNDAATSLVIQPDRKIVVAGSAGGVRIEPVIDPTTGLIVNFILRQSNDVAVARINEDGSQDSDFDADGKVTFDIASHITVGLLTGSQDMITSLTVAPNGQLVLAGSTDLRADGRAIHSQFDDTSAVEPDIIDGNISYRGRTRRELNADSENIIVMRLNGLDGTLDGGFGTRGVVLSDISSVVTRSGVASEADRAQSVAVDSSGRVVVGGFTSYGTRQTTTQAVLFGQLPANGRVPDNQVDYIRNENRNFALLVFSPSGALDNSFNTDGIVTTDLAVDFNPEVDDEAFALSLRPEGKFLLAGRSTRGGTVNSATGDVSGNFALARYLNNGLLDQTFNPDPDVRPITSNDGKVITDFPGANSEDAIRGIAVQDDGGIVAVGVTRDANGRAKFALARYVGTNETLPTLSIGRATNPTLDSVDISESASDPVRFAELVVTISRNPDVPVTVKVQTADGTATTASGDYQAFDPNPTTLTFNPGGPLSQVIRVRVNNDTEAEGPQSFLVQLLDSVNAEIVRNQATVNIIDDDASAVIQFGTPSLTVQESVGRVLIPVTRAGNLELPNTITVTTRDVTTTTADYTPINTVVTFAPGQATAVAELFLAITDDTVDEVDERLQLTLSQQTPAGSAQLGDVTVLDVTIVDNDPIPNMTISDAEVTEIKGGTAFAEFEVSLSDPSSQEIRVDYETVNGTASAPGDFVAKTGTLVFAPGVGSQTIRITINGDTVREADETFSVRLFNQTPTTALVDATGTGKIIDADGPPDNGPPPVGSVPELRINNVQVTETASGTTFAEFTVTLSSAATQEVTVDFATADGSAKSPDDYEARTGTLTFAVGQTQQKIRITINSDNAREDNETFTVRLSNANPASTVIAVAQGTGTIQDAGTTPPPQNLTPTQKFVAQVYRDLLKREVDADGLAFWNNILAAGATRTQVVLGIEASQEFKQMQVRDLFQKYLKRDADANGLAFFSGALLGGATPEDVAGVIAGSAEYFQSQGGGSINGFITALYRDALGREPDAGGLLAFSQALNSGATRQQVARMILTSSEYNNVVVANHYITYLRRQADAAGQAFFAASISAGTRSDQVLGQIIGSDEYFNKFSA